MYFIKAISYEFYAKSRLVRFDGLNHQIAKKWQKKQNNLDTAALKYVM